MTISMMCYFSVLKAIPCGVFHYLITSSHLVNHWTWSDLLFGPSFPFPCRPPANNHFEYSHICMFYIYTILMTNWKNPKKFLPIKKYSFLNVNFETKSVNLTSVNFTTKQFSANFYFRSIKQFLYSPYWFQNVDTSRARISRKKHRIIDTN